LGGIIYHNAHTATTSEGNAMSAFSSILYLGGLACLLAPLSLFQNRCPRIIPARMAANAIQNVRGERTSHQRPRQ
jgi:hypothetical protein